MKKVVLIADREPRSYSQLRHRLTGHNRDVLHAASIEDALQQLDLRKVDLLLVDLDVPGGHFVGSLAQFGPLSPGLRIIGTTEGSWRAHMHFREYLDGMAEKPFALSPLISFIDELLRNPPPGKKFRYLGRIDPGSAGAPTHVPPRVMNYPPAHTGCGHQ